jgi:hypothetical protein
MCAFGAVPWLSGESWESGLPPSAARRTPKRLSGSRRSGENRLVGVKVGVLNSLAYYTGLESALGLSAARGEPVVPSESFSENAGTGHRWRLNSLLAVRVF